MQARVSSGFKTYSMGSTVHLLSLGFLVCIMGTIMPASATVVSLNCDRAGTKVTRAIGGSTETPPELPDSQSGACAPKLPPLKTKRYGICPWGPSYSLGYTPLLPVRLQCYLFPFWEVKG